MLNRSKIIFGKERVILFILLLSISCAIFYTIIYVNGNYRYEYTTDNESDDVYRITQGKDYQDEIIIYDEQMKLKEIRIYIESKHLSDKDIVRFQFGKEIVDYTKTDEDTVVSIPVIESYDNTYKGDLSIRIIGDNSSWIEIKADSQTKKGYIEKKYEVDQLESGRLRFRIFFILLIISNMFLIFIVVFYDDASKILLYILASTVLFLAISIRDVTLVINPQAFAEQIGTAYYWSIHGSFLDSILSTEAGYCAMGLRIWSYLICLTRWGRIHYVQLTNIVLVITSACSCGFFINSDFGLKRNNRILAYLFITYIPLIALACDSNFLYIDLGYWGYMIILYFWLNSSEALKNKYVQLCMCIIIAIFCASKGHYVMFIPVATFHFFMTREREKKHIDIAVFIGGLFQLIMSARSDAVSSWTSSNIIHPKYMARMFMIEIGKVAFRAFGIIIYDELLILIIGMALFICISVYALISFRDYLIKGNNESLNRLMICILIFVTNAFLDITGNWFTNVDKYLKSRYEMFLIVTYIYLVFYIFARNRYNINLQIIVVLTALLSMGIYDEYKNDYYNAWNVTDRITDWKKIADKLVDETTYFIKLDPSNWEYINYNQNASELIYSDTTRLDGLESKEIIAVYAYNNDITKNILLRIKYLDGNVKSIGKVSSDIKTYMTYYMEPFEKNVDYIEFYDEATGMPIYISECSVCYVDPNYQFSLRP